MCPLRGHKFTILDAQELLAMCVREAGRCSVVVLEDWKEKELSCFPDKGSD